MFYHDLYKLAAMKEDGKTKIFRPWDVTAATQTDIKENTHQDCTISTTSELEDSNSAKSTADSIEPNAKPCDNPQLVKSAYQPVYPTSYYQDFPLFFPGGVDDPLLLDSLAQHGYGLEEYARVISQEHQTKLLNSRKQRPKKYRCPHCNVGFSNNGQLKGHIRIHTGERPFKCEESNCGKTFTRNEELTRHKRIHSGLRPFPCAQCGKRFGRKDHLKKHSRTHLQPRQGLYAVPVMLPLDTWAAAAAAGYPYGPMFGY